jgi:hypothetical protein
MRDVIRGRFTGLQDYTIDVQGLKAFIGRLVDSYGDEKQWLISLASFLGRKPPEKWSDDDVSAFEYRLLEFAKRIKDIQLLRFHSERRNDKSEALELIVLKTISGVGGETEVLVALDSKKRAYLEKAKAKIKKELSNLPNNDLANAVLAMLIEDLAKGNDVSETPTKGKEHLKKKQK